MGADTVFISYSHDSTEHKDRVLELSNALRKNGIDSELDRYHVRPEQGWPRWCEARLRPANAKYVLVICTPTYRSRVENSVNSDEGRGVYWEGSLIYHYLYVAKENSRFIPVLLGDETEDGIPIPLQDYTRYRIKTFDRTDPEFERLLRELCGKPADSKPELGPPADFSGPTAPAAGIRVPLPALAIRTNFPPPADISHIDRYAPKELIGREAENKLIDEAWAKAVAGEAHPRVLTFVALGGEGKTALVAKWAIAMAQKGWPDCEAAFAWSFYRQGSSEQVAGSSDLFLAEALTFFGAPAVEDVESGYNKGRRLAQWVGDKRTALVLDGLEPLQYPPTSPVAGQLKDEGLRALLKGLAQRNKGLCLVTTRYAINDLEAYPETAPQKDLAPLSKESGARLLDRLGVKGTEEEREQLSEDIKGHALTLNLIGSYLWAAFGGDIRKRDLIDLGAANRRVQRGHAFHVMDAYVQWLESEAEDGPRALAILRSLGLFDRPADAGCLGALWRAPPIEGLTEPLIALDESERSIVLTQLGNAKLVTVNRDKSGALVSLDAHPLLREYFAKHLRETRGKAWTAAHLRLYEYLAPATTDKEAPTLDDLQPLYQAVAHGCYAGMQLEAYERVYRDRILRGTGPGGFYSLRKLGAFGADLGAVACFFDRPWQQVSANLPRSLQSWLLNQAAIHLRSLGRVAEAREPMRAGLNIDVEHEHWADAAISAGNLVEMELTVGNVGAAIRDGECSVQHADRSGEGHPRIANLAAHADALHQAGLPAAAEARFVQAEAMQAKWQPEFPLLYGLTGFRYCDLLLANAECGAWRRLRIEPVLPLSAKDEADLESIVRPGLLNSAASSESHGLQALINACDAVLGRAKKMFEWRTPNDPLLDIGLDHLTLAHVGLYAAIVRGEPRSGADVAEATHLLRSAGQQDYLARGLLTFALFHAATRHFGEARDDLDEAFEIAERGPMRLHLADIHLHRARLFGLVANRPAAYPWVSARDDLDMARKLIDECGYGRRREELADAEAAWERVYGAAAPWAAN